MIVEGTYAFGATREALWELLMDPSVIAKTMPGTKRLERVSPERYEGLMHVGVGPITAAEFQLVVTIAEAVRPERYTMLVDAKGRFGFTRGTAHVELVPDGDLTAMRYRAELEVGGKIAGVGQRVLDGVSKLMSRLGLEALSREVERRLRGGATA